MRHTLKQFVTLHQKSVYFTFSAVIMLQMVLAFQGFDVCDDGFAATFYQQFFNAPDSVEYNFVYWLSGLVGGIWYELFPTGGILWLRLLAILVNTGTMYLAYRLLRPYMSLYLLLPALTMALFINDFGFLLFYNNHLTAFLAMLSMLFLHRGLIHSNFTYLWISGLLIGLNIFSRLPNLSQLVLILAFPIWYGLKNGGITTMIKPISSFALGFISALGVVTFVLLQLGQFEIMQRAMLSLVDLGSTEQSTHNVGDLLRDYLGHYKQVIKYCILLIFPLTMAWLSTSKRISTTVKVVLYVVILFFCCLVLQDWDFWILRFGIFWSAGRDVVGKEKGNDIIGLYGICDAVLSALWKWRWHQINWLCFTLVVFAFIFLCHSISACEVGFNKQSFQEPGGFKKPKAKAFIILLLISFFIVRLYSWFNQAYFDPGPRVEKVYGIKSKYARGVFTTKERAEIINGLLVELPSYIQPNDYLLVYDKSPMVHFLTQTRPYMYNSWPWIYDTLSFEKKLEQAAKKRLDLPVVVVQKFETIKRFSKPQKEYVSSTAEDNFFHNNKIAAMMNTFLKDHSYQKMWSNDYYDIYIPAGAN
jgi:hypothetical protein